MWSNVLLVQDRVWKLKTANTKGKIYQSLWNQWDRKDLAFWQKLTEVENDRHWLYLPYQVSKYQPETLLGMKLFPRTARLEFPAYRLLSFNLWCKLC